MLQSMTGFAAGQGAKGDFSWTWEIRSVNAKGLDLRIRVPDWIEGLETELRKQVSGALKRGNVTVNLRLSREDTAGAQRLNSQQLDQVLTALAEIEQQAITRHVSLAPSTAAEIIALRGMMEQDEEATDTAQLRTALVEDFQAVLASFCDMRSGEGATLRSVLAAHLDEIETLVIAAQAAAEARRPKARETLMLALAAVLDGAAEVDGKATLDAAEDGTFDAGVVCVSFFQTVPGFFAAGHLARDDGFATGVFCGTQVNFDLVANVDVGLFTGFREFLELDAAFHLVADVDNGLSRFDRDDLAFDDSTLIGRVHFEAFIKEGLEFLHRCAGHMCVWSFTTVFFWPSGCLRRSWIGL